MVMMLLVASVLAVTLLTQGSPGNTDDLDPANPGFAGAQGLAHVLADHGVTVTVVRSQDELLHQRVDASTTVAIIGAQSLSGRTAHTRCLRRQRAAARP